MAAARGSRLLGRLGLSMGALAGCLLLLEIGARAFLSEPATAGGGLRRGAFQQPGDHPVSGPGFSATVHVNRAGYVDAEWGPRRPDVPRVVLLGDSFVQAAQVDLDQGLGRRLAADLSALQGQPVEVLSLGVPGAGTATALGLLRDAVPRLQPDLVVLAFLVSNDVFNNSPRLDTKPDKPYFRLVAGKLQPWPAQDAHLGAVADSAPWRMSALVRAVGRRLLASQEARRRVDRGGGLPLDLRLHDPQGGADWDEAWAVTAALVAAMAQESASQGWAFGVLLLPDAIMATDQGRAEALARWPALKAWDLDAARARARSTFSPLAPVFDLQPALAAQDAAGVGPLYLREDGHWTAQGHAVAAQAAAPVIGSWMQAPR